MVKSKNSILYTKLILWALIIITEIPTNTFPAVSGVQNPLSQHRAPRIKIVKFQKQPL